MLSVATEGSTEPLILKDVLTVRSRLLATAARFIPRLHLMSRGTDAVSTSSELGIVHHCRSLIIG